MQQYRSRSLPPQMFHPERIQSAEKKTTSPSPSRRQPDPTDFVIVCPNCGEQVLIEEIACSIFRHAAYKETGKQIHPHTSEEECARLRAGDLIYGCGFPFRLIKDSDEASGWKPIKCGYI